MYQSYKMDLAGRPLVVDINRVGKQANGCAFMHYGDTTVLCTATASEKPIGVPQNASALPSPARSREQRPIRATFLPKRPLSAAADCVRAALLPSAKPKRFAS